MMHTYIALSVPLFFSHIPNRLYFLLSNFPPTSDFMCKRNNLAVVCVTAASLTEHGSAHFPSNDSVSPPCC